MTPAASPHHLAYRPDIDGLRTLAVLPVVLFHIGFPGFFGGFIGVDVFFVISGYLITGILVRELQQGRFSLLEFYRRRVLRIFPALFVMLAVVTALAIATMLPSELIRFGQSLAATTGFFSNILFYSESGYFAPDAHSKVLLHTWSLAVEEQFYLFWPLILAGLHARSSGVVRTISLAITAASFALAVWLLPIDPSATFYLIPTRAWELMIGALIAVMPFLSQQPRLVREVLAGSGMLAILIGIKFYNDRLPFPGASALLPCLGAGAIIAAGCGGTSLAGKILSWRPLVFIGKISFSLYLWHWPVIVFVQIGLLLEHTWPVKLAELAASFLLAALSWRFVEQPARTGAHKYDNRRVLGGAAAMMALCAAVGTACIVSAGLPGRFSPAQLALAKYETYDGDHRYRGGQCFAVSDNDHYDADRCLKRAGGKPAVLIVGDSHAAHLWPGLHSLDQRIDVLQATQTGCRPVLPMASRKPPGCEKLFRHTLQEWLPAHPVDTVVLAGRWTAADMAGLPAAIQAARRGARQVLVVGPMPQYAAALPRYLVREAGGADASARLAALVDAVFALDPVMRKVVTEQGADYFSPVEALCKGRDCRSMANASVPLQFDYGHLTAEGSTLVAGMLLEKMTPSARPPTPVAASIAPASAH